MSENVSRKQDQPIRVIAFFAHPDDGEVKMGGTAAKFAEMGHKVKFVSLSNGDAGHYEEGGGPLSVRRHAEAQEAARRLGIDEYLIMDNHDGELLSDINNRKQVIREIRKWNADIVIGHRPNDYHPDHRYAGMLVMDAAFLVVVPNVAADTPALRKNPLFLYMEDGFTKPNPFTPDITIGVDETFEKKIHAMDAHVSQLYEWLPYVGDMTDEVPEDHEGRLKWIEKWLNYWNSGMSHLSEGMQKSLIKWYGAEKAAKISNTESFEIAEYGHQPDDKEIRRLFPMLK